MSFISKILFLFLTLPVGLAIGAMFAYKSMYGFLIGFIETPSILISSLFCSVGVIVIPCSLLYLYLFVRYELSLWFSVIFLLAFAYLSYDVLDYELNRSFEAKMQIELQRNMDVYTKIIKDNLKKKPKSPGSVETPGQSESLRQGDRQERR